MRKLACLAVSLIAGGAFSAATVSTASATAYPPPCPVSTLVHFGNGTVTVTPPGCTVGPVTIPVPAISLPGA